MVEEIKERIIRHIFFLEKELEDYSYFKNLTREEYIKNRSKRRDVERWIENIVNVSIDIAKIVITSENLIIPNTYREIILTLTSIEEFKKENIEKISEYVYLRNIIVHEYLDIKWISIKKFIDETENFYKKFIEDAKKYIIKISGNS